MKNNSWKQLKTAENSWKQLKTAGKSKKKEENGKKAARETDKKEQTKNGGAARRPGRICVVSAAGSFFFLRFFCVAPLLICLFPGPEKKIVKHFSTMALNDLLGRSMGNFSFLFFVFNLLIHLTPKYIEELTVFGQTPRPDFLISRN